MNKKLLVIVFSAILLGALSIGYKFFYTNSLKKVGYLHVDKALLNIGNYSISPTRNYMVMDAIDKEDDRLDMRIDMAIHILGVENKRKIQVVSLESSKTIFEFYSAYEDNPQNFQWTDNSVYLFLQKQNAPTLTQIDFIAGTQNPYFFPYQGFAINANNSTFLAWGHYQNRLEEVTLNGDAQNKLFFLDSQNLEVFEEVELADIVYIVEVIWGRNDDELLITSESALYYYQISTNTLSLVEPIGYLNPWIKRVPKLHGRYNPTHNLLILGGDGADLSLYHLDLGCIVLHIDTPMKSPQWFDESHLVHVVTNLSGKNRDARLQLLEVGFLSRFEEFGCTTSR